MPSLPIGARIGARVKALIEQKGVSYSSVARRADLSSQAVVTLARGETERPSINMLVQLAGALGMTYDELIGDSIGAIIPAAPEPGQLGADALDVLEGLNRKVNRLERLVDRLARDLASVKAGQAKAGPKRAQPGRRSKKAS